MLLIAFFYSRRIQEVLFVCFTRYGYSSSCPMLGASNAIDIATVGLTPDMAVEAVDESAWPTAALLQNEPKAGRLNLSTRESFPCKPTTS